MSHMLYRYPATTTDTVKVANKEVDYTVVATGDIEKYKSIGWHRNPNDAIKNGNPADTNKNGITSKAELIKYADEKGITIKRSWGKEKLQKAIDAAESQ